ncbi:hypothetical protein GUJ93_ZPchr0010g7916 [Zizania palustris]|uniref:Uncharacterized protein n=1 Tax=Zizania palustris TaxID=103762 RepID=A0A8J6BFK0_ZIZPA|nr:hypothetical protein GUJ93_ZPchr0010g7916 [Zizania palustris]
MGATPGNVAAVLLRRLPRELSSPASPLAPVAAPISFVLFVCLLVPFLLVCTARSGRKVGSSSAATGACRCL